MQARPGDRIVIPGRRIGQTVRDGLILEVRGTDGDGPFLVRWSDDGHEGMFWPGSDAQIKHVEPVDDTR